MALDNWVADKLSDILGFREKSLSSYVLALAKKAKDVPSLVKELQNADVPMNPQTQQFAKDLFSKVPRTGPSQTANQKADQQKMALLKKNSSYSLIIDEEDKKTNSCSCSCFQR